MAELVIYEVTELELQQLKEGSPVALHLNFSIFLLSTCLSFLVALMTTQVSGKTYVWFVVVIVGTGLISTVLGGFWLKNRNRSSDIVKKIKERLPIEGIQLPLSGSIETAQYSGGLTKD